jgi:hypothetical protein
MGATNKVNAGKQSGAKRAKLARLRQFFVLLAFENLKPIQQTQPSSNQSRDALVSEFRRLLQHSPIVDLALDEYEAIVTSPRRHASAQLMRLMDEVLDMLRDDHNLHMVSLRKARRGTIIKDLEALGVRSKLRKPRSG